MVASPLQFNWHCQGLDAYIVSNVTVLSREWLSKTSHSIAITGLVVLGGHTQVEDPRANFRNAFAGTSSNGNGLSTALVKVNFAYAGFEVGTPVLTFHYETNR